MKVFIDPDGDIEEIKEAFRLINPELYERLLKIDGSDEFFRYMVKPLRVSVRVNTLKAEVDEVVENLKELITGRVPWCEEGFYLSIDEFSRIPEHQLGLIFSQEAASMIPPLVMELEPKMTVLDIAASPGAKTTQIAQYLQNEGCIVANDVKHSRINILISNLQRCGVLIAKVTVKDGRYFGRFRNRFDAVLVDAPCSNMGMIRKNYRNIRLWKMRDCYGLSKLQKSLLMAAYKAVKPGGVVVYSTCTLEPIENEEVVDYILRNTDAEIEEVNLPVKGVEPFTKFDGKEYSEEVRKCLRLHPQSSDTEGFFVAKLRKP
ncbi:NOL1/NOP2/sun family putative RNA methylase [Archaeoglobus fulgidus]|uniref:Proliferating-cell nucleolar antigen P120, putative n=3 Tax=Archaeoglobus fulgidus TaxID=2234 RepID=O29405_ARCFU|nr:NOL1/NOP2/sun family putative RNA methylase [Archaeoglobus fulgidus]AAB90385.1 proliferating-cell nucleolar antigen P120, putative [Archaeoglobus fulgidus DSM 4304]AIG97729.1 NOL1/NOP2/sun family putative RNA methylase [Archaeoglobus fulgidus DSM 8774]KUJ93700.1 MAG: Proliferating cell nucleolar antigen P120 [Archaeoglobus fulgidus]KUK06760.1 MAG: Proliferating-cell nucleolar antigen P120 [Archaeoglobus fulgidus]